MYSSPPRYTSPPGYSQIRYTATPVTPANNCASHKFTYTASPPKDPFKTHKRHASHGPTSTTTYTYSPHPPTYYASPAGGYYTPTFTTQADFVSPKEHVHGKSARRAAEYDGSKQRTYHSTKHPIKTQEYAPRPHAGRDGLSAGADGYHDDEGYCSGKASSPSPQPHHDYDYGYRVTDSYGHAQVAAGQKRTADSPKNKATTRTRAASFTAHPAASSRPRATSKVKSPRKATAADAHRARIPAGYSYKNWDPTEEPILLLGSVFDANSLGKWIYDWTVHHHRAATPMSDLAGDLWLLLIQLAGKIKRAEECLERIRHPDDRDLVEDFLESGERLWERFSKILKACEEYMWRAASKEAKKKGTSAAASMGARSGCEFVDSIFGRDRKLEDTEKLMTGMRLWSMRFDANCEEILRNPSG